VLADLEAAASVVEVFDEVAAALCWLVVALPDVCEDLVDSFALVTTAENEGDELLERRVARLDRPLLRDEVTVLILSMTDCVMLALLFEETKLICLTSSVFKIP